MSSVGLRKSIISRSLLTIVEFAAALISFPYAARVLSPEGLGKIDFANAAVAYFVTIGAFGIAEYGAREVGRVKGHSQAAANFISGIEFFRILFSLILALIYLGVIVPFFGGGSQLFLISTVVILTSSLNLVWALEVFGDFGFVTVARLFSKIGFIAALFYWVKEPRDVTVYFVLMILSDLFFYLCSVFRLNFKFGVSFLEGKKYLSVVSPQVMRGLLQVFMLNILQSSISGIPALILGKMGLFHDLGIFSSAYRILMMGFYALVPLTSVFFVRSMALASEVDHSVKEKSYDLNANVLLLLSTPVALGIFSISSDLIHLLVGDQYMESVPVLKYLSFLVVIFSFINFWGMQIAFGFGKEKSLLIINLVGLIAMSSLVFVGVRLGGSMGVAVGYVLGYFIILCGSFWVGRKFYSLKNIRIDALRTLVAGFAMLCGLHFTQIVAIAPTWLLVIKIIGGAIIYFMTLLLLRHSLMIRLLKRKI